VKSIAVARDYILDLAHLLREGRIIRRQLVTTIGRLAQEEAFAIALCRQLMTSLGKTTPSELPNLWTFSSSIGPRPYLLLRYRGSGALGDDKLRLADARIPRGRRGL
jgi:hypothetical protein